MYITMKIYRYISLATLVLSLAACSQDEDFAPQSDSDAVRINATIGTKHQSRITYSSDDEVSFERSDQIRVINQTRKAAGKGKYDAKYVYRENSDEKMEWFADSKTGYVVWEGTGANIFYGVYPHTADYDKFTILTDQSSTNNADWMTATTTATKFGFINLTFSHRLAMVTVKVTMKNNEFSDNDQISSSAIYTKGTKVTVSYGTGTDGTDVYTLLDGEQRIFPRVYNIASCPTFTAIVAPVAYNKNDKFMTFNIGNSSKVQELTVLAKASQLTAGLKPGNHYNFDLTVGKEKVDIRSVSVTDGQTVALLTAEWQSNLLCLNKKLSSRTGNKCPTNPTDNLEAVS